MKRKLAGLLLLIIGLWVSLSQGQKITKLIGRATGEKANIVVTADQEIGPIHRNWQNIGQGGEETGGMLKPAANQIKQLAPKYVRLDHVYDFYEVVKKENGKLIFNWTKLDQEINVILQSGAKPFLSLSYMPPGFGEDITALPYDWNDWFSLVKATIEHYSGKNQQNISDVYYEVWNEPDLFGGFKVYGDKNYLELYRISAQAANQATNTQPFKFGGPATSGFYRNWIEGLLKLCQEENLRLDFISWHRYSLNYKDFNNDVQELSQLIAIYPKLALIERIISEWGPDPENNQVYDSNTGAAHALASLKEMLGKIHKAFWFELTDGKHPEGKAFWGRFGLYTHPSQGLQPKPRQKMFLWLNDLGETRILLTGEGSWVRGLAARKNNQWQIYLTNYDRFDQHSENVPITINKLPNGKYTITEEKLGEKPIITERLINDGRYFTSINLRPNQSVRLLLTAN